MNPAALKANVGDLPRGGLIIANSDEFTKRNLAKVGYEANPLENDELSDYVVQAVAMTSLTLGAVEEIGASKKDGSRAKNMFALGLLSWMYSRELEHSETFIREKFARKPEIAEANVLALSAGWNYGETTEAFGTTYEVSPAKLKSGEYRQISGNMALAYGIVVGGPAGQHAGDARQLPDHARVGHPARAVQAQELQRPHLPGGGRDRGHRRGPRGVLRRRARRDQHLGSRRGAEGRGHRPRRDGRTPAARRRRAARWALHRSADQDRAGRSAAGALRPQRRVAGRGARPAVAVGLLRDRGRGRADRADLPDAGDPPVGRRHRQRFRAVAHPGRHHLRADRRTPSPSPASRSSPTPATPRRWPASSPSPERRASNTASAGSSRPTVPATSPTSRRTTI